MSGGGGFKLNAVGRSDGGATASGLVGEQVSSVLGSASAVTLATATEKDVTSITLGAGVWLVAGNVVHRADGATSYTCQGAGIATAVGTNLQQGSRVRCAAYVQGATSASDQTHLGKPRLLTLAVSTVIYLVAYAEFSVGVAKAYGQINAIRMGAV